MKIIKVTNRNDNEEGIFVDHIESVIKEVLPASYSSTEVATQSIIVLKSGRQVRVRESLAEVLDLLGVLEKDG